MEFTWLLVLLIIVFVTYYCYCKYYLHNYWSRQNVPSMPNPLPLFGHILPALSMRENMVDLIERAYKSFDTSMIGFYFMNKPAIIIRDPELVRNVLQTNFSSFRDNFVTLSKKNDPLLARSSFFTNDHHLWKEGRNRISNHLSGKELKVLLPITDEVCARTRMFIENRLTKNCHYECDLKKLFTRCTGELVANAAFSIDGQSFDENPARLSFTRVAVRPFETSFVNDLKQIVLFFFPNAADLLGVSLLEKKIVEFMRQNVKVILEKRQQNGQEVREDYLQSTVRFSADNLHGILEDVVNFYMDIYDTSSSAIANLFYNLSIHPNIQTKLREHVRTVLNDHKGQISYETLKSLNYLEQVIYESMRMVPSFAFQPKYCTEDITLVANDGLSCRLKAADPIFIPVACIQTDGKYWPNPQIFDPERFSPENRLKNHRFTFLAFGEGPRMCVGKRLGLMLVKQVTASLITRFAVEASARTSVPLKYEAVPIFYGFKGGVWASFVHLNDDDC